MGDQSSLQRKKDCKTKDSIFPQDYNCSTSLHRSSSSIPLFSHFHNDSKDQCPQAYNCSTHPYIGDPTQFHHICTIFYNSVQRFNTSPFLQLFSTLTSAIRQKSIIFTQYFTMKLGRLSPHIHLYPAICALGPAPGPARAGDASAVCACVTHAPSTGSQGPAGRKRRHALIVSSRDRSRDPPWHTATRALV